MRSARFRLFLDLALSSIARTARAAVWYCSLERPYALPIFVRPCSSNAANWSVACSSESRNIDREDISDRNVSVSGEEAEKMSRKLGTPPADLESVEYIVVYAWRAR